MGLVIRRLTEKEIRGLPFPETARAIGGILVLEDRTITEEELAEIKKLFNRSISRMIEEELLE
jgi:hypothetical protein